VLVVTLLLLLQVQAERTAWQLAEQLGLDLVTILPNFVLVSTQHSSMHNSNSCGDLLPALHCHSRCGQACIREPVCCVQPSKHQGEVCL
jgi:predicted RecB family endonuclease